MKITKMNLIFYLMICLSSSGCSLNGSGSVITESRSVGTFNGIELKCAANVYLTQGKEESVKVEAEDNLIQYISTTVNDNELIIKEDKNLKYNRPVNVYITVREICLLDLSGTGNIVMRNVFNCSSMNFRLSGSGDIRAMVMTNNLKATVNGSGSMNINGRAKSIDVRVNGSGNVAADGLKAMTGKVSLTGSGNTKIDVEQDLNASITGSGNLYITAEPESMNAKVTGSGKVLKL